MTGQETTAADRAFIEAYNQVCRVRNIQAAAAASDEAYFPMMRMTERREMGTPEYEVARAKYEAAADAHKAIVAEAVAAGKAAVVAQLKGVTE